MQESNGTISLVGGLEKLILLKRPYNPMWATHSMQSNPDSNDIFKSNEQ
jgi:hypothetical protein